MNYLKIALTGIAIASPFSKFEAAEVPGFLKPGKTYKLTFTVPLSIARDPSPPPTFPAIMDDASPGAQKTWFVEVLQIDPSGWIFCDNPRTINGLGGGRNPLLPPVWINLGAVAVIQPIALTARTGGDIPKNPGN
jgi:hypothetical protein